MNNSSAIEEALLNYRRDLRLVHDKLQGRQQQKSAEVIERWLGDLKLPMTKEDLSRHAQTAIRALGGMESIGEIALASGDKAFLASVESLYESAKKLKALCG